MNKFAHSSFDAVVTATIGLALMIALPGILDDFDLIQATLFIVMSILAVSLGFIWGFGGILCFGQASFFGLGVYTYSVAALNFGDSTLPVVLSVLVPAAFAVLMGYLMFYGRLSDVYMAVITLTMTLILFNLFNSTSGPEWTIGNAPLGGFNGIPSVPIISLPWNPGEVVSSRGMFYLSLGVLLLVYLGLRGVLASKVGRVIVAIRENEQRALLLGYDVRAYKLFTFTLGGAIAGLAGCLFANWGSYASPTIFGLAQSAQIIIWVIVGGHGTLVGPIVGCVVIQWLTAQIGTQQTFNANLVLGVILVSFVLIAPKGLVPGIGQIFERLRSRRIAAKLAQPTPAESKE